MQRAVDVINDILREELDVITEGKRNAVAERIVNELNLEHFVLMGLSDLQMGNNTPDVKKN